MNLINGKILSEEIYKTLYLEINALKIKPRLGIILASDDQASRLYVEKMKIKRAELLGVKTELKKFSVSSSLEDILNEVNLFNNNPLINGILIQLPFFKHLETSRMEILNKVNILKDADGLTSQNLGLSSQLSKNAIYPATVDAILECIKFTLPKDKDLNQLQGKNIVIINNSILIGKPLGMILSSYNATIILVNKYTKDLKSITLNADIVISATDQGNIIDHTLIKNNSILIDVTSIKKNNKIIGDIISSPELKNKVSYLTPVPGGVGPLTIACLFRNLIKLTKLQMQMR